MRRWRVPLLLSGLVLLAQLFRAPALLDVVTGQVPSGVVVRYPLLHVILAPLTVPADWLNGGSTGDLIGFALWSVIALLLWRLLAGPPRRLWKELAAVSGFTAALGVFIWWGARWSRPVPALGSTDSSQVIFDIHTHTTLSHDGRPGFDVAANAAWHARAGFDAAFVTDHNAFGAAREWQQSRGEGPPRLLAGEELSLSGLHVIVLGNDSALSAQPWNQSFDSSLALIGAIRTPAPGDTSRATPYLVASLPEYWRHHWGSDLGRVVTAGVEGLEIWTTSPKAMDFPRARRQEAVARARSLGVALFGATDMHGLGFAATVWNVIALPGWRGLDDAALTGALLAHFRQAPAGILVVALRRYQAPTRNAQIAGTPLGLALALRTASPAHGLALLAWIWTLAVLGRRFRHTAGH